MADGWVQLKTEDFESHNGVEELNRMLKILFDVVAGDADTVRVYNGSGVPSIAAGNGSLFLRTDTGKLYVMESGTWTVK